MAGVPFIFGNATTSIPLSNLDADFNTGLTIGNTTVGLGNTVTTLGNVTLTNVNIVSGTVPVPTSIANGTSNVSISSSGGNINVVTGGTVATFPQSTGTVMVSGNMPAFNVYANTNQTISNATVTKVALQARTFDTASAFDITTNYRFQPLVAGYYQLNGQVQYTGAVVAYNALIFYKNGSEVARGALGGSATTYGASGSCLVYLNGSTDYMEMYVQQNSGGNLTLNSTSFYVQFSGAMVRSA